MSQDPVPLYLTLLIILFLVLQFFTSIYNICLDRIDIDAEKIPGYKRSVRAASLGMVFVCGILMYLLLFVNPGVDIPFGVLGLIIFFLVYLIIFVYLPEFIAGINPEKAGRISRPVFLFAKGMVFPLVFITERAAAGISMIFGAKSPLHPVAVTEEEIISLVNERHEQGELMAQEANMIQNIFEFDDKQAKDVMMHRADIVAIDGDGSFREAMELFQESSFSRFPVYLNDLDHIIGTIHMRELLIYSLEKTNYPKKIRDLDGIMRPPVFVPETHGINTLFTQMKKEKSHMAIVKDEYGQTSGIISMEDILEEIVGNIFDEHDKETANIIDRGSGLFIMFGRTPLDEVANCLSLEFNNEDIETLNGFLIHSIGRIPAEGESFNVEYEGFRFEVLDVKDNIIQAVKVQRLVEENP